MAQTAFFKAILKTRMEIFKKEAGVDTFLIQFRVVPIFTPEMYLQHLQDRSFGFDIRNESCGMGKKLTALVKNPKEIKQTPGIKKRSSGVPRSSELYQIKRKLAPLNIKQ